MPRALAPAALATCLALAAIPAPAHEATAHHGGLASGVLHPLLGIDHLAAIVAVGLLGAFLGGRAIAALPGVFLTAMVLGAAAGAAGMPLPGVEQGIAASAIVLGALVAAATRMPLWAAGAAVALFAVFHGHAHGTHLPAVASPAAYAAGFVLATGLLHLAGIALGLLARWPAGTTAIRAGGAGISALGLAVLAGLG